MAALLFFISAPIFPLLHFPNKNQQILHFLTFLLLISPSISSISDLFYSNHCNSIVPKSSISNSPIQSDTSFNINNGYFIGGDNVFGKISEFEFTFYSKSVFFTEKKGTLQISGTLILSGGRNDLELGKISSRGRFLRLVQSWNPRRFDNRGRIRADLTGFWSEESGKLCMVGNGSGRSVDGMSIDFSVVFKLNYPKYSNIRSSIVGGFLENLESVDSGNYFDQIRVFAYAQMKYEYTKVLQARSSCSLINDSVDQSLGFLNRFQSICDPSNNFFWSSLKLEFRNNCTEQNCSPLFNNLGFQPKFMKFTMVDCAANGNLRLVVLFSNYSGFKPSMMMFEPGMAMVAEGSWVHKNNQLCLIACPVNNVSDALADFAVDDCSIGMNLTFPAVLTIENRNTIVGSIWSKLNETSPGYFSSIRFKRLFRVNTEYDNDLKYKYTKIDTLKKSCKETDFGKYGKKRYPDPINSRDLMFVLVTKTSDGKLGRGSAMPLALGETIYHYPRMENFTYLTKNESIWNISYSFRFSYHGNKSVERHVLEFMSAEGIYNSRTGMICMVGCRRYSSFERQGNYLDSKDCSILINIQIPPLNPKPGEFLSGTIRSTRGNLDPLFFKPVEISSHGIYRGQAVESVWRMDVEITMIIISLTLSCIFVSLQLRHSNKHSDVLSSISIAMLVFLTLGHMIVLVLNFEAFLRDHKKQNVLLGSTGWLEVNEVVVRLMTMATFLLHFRLLQVAWSARSVNESKNILWLAERKTIQLCLIVYIAGGFLAWLVHPRFEKTLHFVPHTNVETRHYHWEDMQSYAGLVVDGFLFPQVILNALCDSKGTSLTPPFYIGTTILRAIPHLYDAYRSRHYIPHLNSSYFYAKPNGDIYSLAWDIIIPCGGALFALLIYIQQRFGGAFIVWRKLRRHGLYEMVPIANSLNVP